MILRLQSNKISRKIPTIFLLVIIAITGWTYALNINLNSGTNLEFGQGVALTTTCDSYLTARITREFDSIDSIFYVKDLIIGDISIKLHSKRVSVTLRNDPSQTTLTSSDLYFELDQNGIEFTSPLSHTDSINYTAVSSYGANEIGTSAITFTNLRKANGSKIPADDVSRILIETSKGGGCTAPTISCATVSSVCQVGSTGPGGGVVFYVATNGFTEAGTGRTFKYIEAAPKTWISGVVDPYARLCVDNNNVSSALATAVASAKQNTDAYAAEADCTGTASSGSDPSGLAKVVSAIRSYDNPFISGSSDVGTWHLGTLNEMIALCKVARFGALVASSKTNCNDSGGTLDTSNWRSNPVYPYLTSSKQNGAGWASYIYFTTGVVNNSSAVQTTIGYFRPIRYFN